MITIHFDGSCWPNPGGQAGYGAIIRRDGIEIKRITGTLPAGQTSNNVAEYAALIAGVEWVINREKGKYWISVDLIEEPVQCFGDSQLVIKQMWGWPPGRKWKIKEGLYEANARHAKELLTRFRSITGTWVPREENAEADEISRPAEVVG